MSRVGRFGLGMPAVSTKETEEKREHYRACEAGDKDPSPQRRIQNDFATAGFLRRIGQGLFRRGRLLRETCSDHAFFVLGLLCGGTPEQLRCSSAARDVAPVGGKSTGGEPNPAARNLRRIVLGTQRSRRNE